MGLLAESKSRKSIGKDPNNTKWTRDTTTFGQKILRSHGWEPGQYLGARNAPHSELHTAANASYIRVALKDDMKGLGFTKSKEDEVTGLDVFSDLLSRLNGKSQTEVDEDKAARLVIKTNRYVEQKWGPMRFVRGGLLVGDAMEETVPTSSDSTSSTPSTPEAESGRKRKAASIDEDSSDASSEEDEKQKKKRRKEEKKTKKKSSSKLALTEVEIAATEKEEKKKRKEKKKSRKDVDPEAEAPETSSTGEETMASDDVGDSEEESNKKRSKREKKERKEKGEKKDKKRDKKDKKNKEAKEKKKRKKGSESEGGETPESGTASAALSAKSTPIPSGTTTPMSGRNFVRSRFIAQKQRVLMDTEALNQILMIKT